MSSGAFTVAVYHSKRVQRVHRMALLCKIPYMNAIDDMPAGMWPYLHRDTRLALDVSVRDCAVTWWP
jgi:hypothetical protein